MKRNYTTRRHFIRWSGLGSLSLLAAPLLPFPFERFSLAPTQSSQGETAAVPPFQSRQSGICQVTLSTPAVVVNDRGKAIATSPVTVNCFTEPLGHGVALTMVKIPAGSVVMGSPTYESGRFTHEQQALAEVPAVWMAMTPITQAVYHAVIGRNPAVQYGDHRWIHGQKPVVGIDAPEAIAFCNALSQRTGRSYRLPTDAEWEYACRAGTTSPFHSGATITAKLANYNASAPYAREAVADYRGEPTPVGQFFPNGFGLWDMHGNVWEWCTHHRSKPSSPTPSETTAAATGIDFLLRGGAWNSYPWVCRSATILRHGDSRRLDTFGLRVVCAERQPET